jgi:hypothetical protein
MPRRLDPFAQNSLDWRGEVDVERGNLRWSLGSDIVDKGDVEAKERQEEWEQTLQAYKAILPSLREITVFLLFFLLMLWMMFAKLHGCDMFHLSCLIGTLFL